MYSFYDCNCCMVYHMFLNLSALQRFWHLGSVLGNRNQLISSCRQCVNPMATRETSDFRLSSKNPRSGNLENPPTMAKRLIFHQRDGFFSPTNRRLQQHWDVFFSPPVLFNLKLSKVGNPFRTSILKQLCVCAMLRCFYNDKFTPLKTSLIRNQHVLVSKSWVTYMMFGQMFVAWVELYWVGFFRGNATESSCVATVVLNQRNKRITQWDYRWK